jgi:hypothetical protein
MYRSAYGDFDGDLDDDRIVVYPMNVQVPDFTDVMTVPWPSDGATTFESPDDVVFGPLPGFNYQYSRHLMGDVDGNGRDDVVIIHRAGGGGLRGFVQPAFHTGSADAIGGPELALSLGGSWSYDSSRQLMADTDADGYDDLISIHRTPRGIGVYRHLSTGSSFAAPETLNHLIGWNFAWTKESVADTWGELIV